jgi:retron-type reverse transcriptase
MYSAWRRTKFVVTADIAGFFENISIKRLRYELARIGSPEPVLDLLSQCLNKWSVADERGIPQGVLASDVLAKLYMESFDKRLRDAGHSHVRYADDIRVFCRSRTEARRALVLVTEMLRERGLTVQSAKDQDPYRRR